jgi:hypothetical protein
MNADELMMLTEDQIDFESLSIDILKNLALGDELFMATSALAELGYRDLQQAEIIAWKILSEQKGDSHLQALALEVMFNCNPDKTIDFIQTYRGKMNNILLDAVEDIIKENNLANFQDSPVLIEVS